MIQNIVDSDGIGLGKIQDGVCRIMVFSDRIHISSSNTPILVWSMEQFGHFISDIKTEMNPGKAGLRKKDAKRQKFSLNNIYFCVPGEAMTTTTSCVYYTPQDPFSLSLRAPISKGNRTSCFYPESACAAFWRALHTRMDIKGSSYKYSKYYHCRFHSHRTGIYLAQPGQEP